MAKRGTPKGPKLITALKHDKARRRNIPTAEMQSFAEQQEEREPVRPVRYERATPLPKGATRERDEDLDPQIVWNGARIRLSPDQVRQLQEKGEVEIGEAQLTWRGKDRQDWSDLVVQAPPLYIQEKVHPKVIIDDLVRRSARWRVAGGQGAGHRSPATDHQPDLFGDFNGLDPEARTEFYQHDQHWSNRMILGDSLYVMASLATREGLKGKVQCIYIDPPYGIKFNSNWQVSTASRDVKDGKREDVSREPEQVKAFRDTWKDGIHSYLTYLRDRLTVARELLTESGSIFVQIGDENVHRVRAVMDEVFGEENIVAEVTFTKTTSATNDYLSGVADYIIWYAKNKSAAKYRPIFRTKSVGGEGGAHYSSVVTQAGELRPATPDEIKGRKSLKEGEDFYTPDQLQSASMGRQKGLGAASWFGVEVAGRTFTPTAQSRWKTSEPGMDRLKKAGRVVPQRNALRYLRRFGDFRVFALSNVWTDFGGATDKRYVVETTPSIVERCLLMTTDPGDLVLDPTCGSGTTAYVAEQWGRRWITIDTSRVALALARARIMGARYPYYFLADTPEGRQKEGEVTGKPPASTPTHGDIRQGFVYERAPHVTLKSIANNTEIDVIWDEFQAKLEPLRKQLNELLANSEWRIANSKKDDPLSTRYSLLATRPLEEWEIPREAGEDWPEAAKKAHAAWWEARIARQKKIDDSIARNADVEFLYDRPYEDRSRVRVAGPFTVESLSPHRVVPADEEELSDALRAVEGKRRRTKLVTPPTDFAEMVLENLRTAGVQQQAKQDAIKFTSLQAWPGEYIGAVGTFSEHWPVAGPRPMINHQPPATRHRPPRDVRRSSSGRSSARSRGSTSSPRRARRARRASTC